VIKTGIDIIKVAVIDLEWVSPTDVDEKPAVRWKMFDKQVSEHSDIN